jgi:mRNA interferase RelE/StbE
MYEIEFATTAQKYLKKLNDKKLKNILYEAFHKIKENPYAGMQKSGDLADVYGYDFYYNKVNYEIAYLVSEDNLKKLLYCLQELEKISIKNLKIYIKNN